MEPVDAHQVRRARLLPAALPMAEIPVGRVAGAVHSVDADREWTA
jgi:hypothetical protein